MSEKSESQQRTQAAEDGLLEPERPHISRGLSNSFSVAEKQAAGVESKDGGQDSESQSPAVTTSPKQEKNIKDEEAVSMSESASGPAKSDADHGEMARDIERRASEHLAKRAAEMTLDDGEERPSSSAVSTTSREKEQLPETPPPPVPPRKDSIPPTKPQPIEDEYDEKHPPPPPNEETANDVPEAPQGTSEPTGEEIQNIMEQFGEGGPGEQDIMSPLLERQQPMLVLPPRSSSLEKQPAYTLSKQTTGGSAASPLSRQGTGGSVAASSVSRVKSDDQESIASGTAGSIFQPPPPSPDPEPALPFDFHRFLEQLRHKSADPVARFLRSFLTEFGKKQWAVHEQVKIISDFLEFISKKMGQCDVWRTVSDAEFDNAREGMEKLVMNRLYTQTFSPAIPAATGGPRRGGRGGRSAVDQASPHGPGRRGQHQEDVEKDGIIAQKIRIYGWIRDEHLDIKPIGEKGKKFLTLAQQELLKINTYRAPRDKVICVLNCCKVIFGYLRNSKSDQSADAFIPMLIYTVLQARPEHLASNVQYIWRFRNQDKLGGETGYYMSSLMGVVTFIENLDRTTLTISDEEFEKNVEQAVSAIAEKNRSEEYEEKTHSSATAGPMQHLSEKAALSRPEVTPRNSQDAERSTPRRNVSQRLNEKAAYNRSDNEDEGDTDAVTGLLRTIQKPLNSIGRIFSDDGQSTTRPNSSSQPGSTPRGLSPAPRLDRRASGEGKRPSGERQRVPQEVIAKQASAEAAQAQQMRVREHRVVVETLQSMFPNLDREVIADVVRAEEGNVGRAVDACLALSG